MWGLISTLRPVANLLAAALALLLLGLLLLVSSASDDRSQRSVDHNLRQLREVGSAIQSTVVTADGLERDMTDRLNALKLAFQTSRDQLRSQATSGLARQDSLMEHLQRPALQVFNSIDPSVHEPLTDTALQQQLARLDRDAGRLGDAVDGFVAAHGSYLRRRDVIQEQGRDLVRELRQRGYDSAADTAFAGVQQALDRARRMSLGDTSAMDVSIRRIQEIALPDTILRPPLQELAQALADLTDDRQHVNEQLQTVASSEFPLQAEQLREQVGADHMHLLRSVSEARVLLNVFTLLTLLILVYFGVRLQVSHRALNQSHDRLEERVRERTRALESAYEELKESQVQLVQAEKMSSLGQLVAGVVHEINTPLLYVLNNTDMTRETIVDLDRQLEPLRALVRTLNQVDAEAGQLQVRLDELRREIDVDGLGEMMEEIQTLAGDSSEGLRDIDELVKSLKDFSRLDRATYDKFDVRDGLDKTLLITKNLLKYGIRVERDFQEIPEILCAPSRVNQVFINLVTNAAQAMDGEGTLGIATRADDDGWVHVTVSDTGCGIPEENLQKVLDPFFTTKPVGQGTGLGLSIVRKIMDEHQGRMQIDSTVGAGTRITLSFPVAGAPQVTTIEQEKAA